MENLKKQIKDLYGYNRDNILPDFKPRILLYMAIAAYIALC